MIKPTCEICGVRPATRAGEHIWPAWFLKLRDSTGTPPYTWSSSGVDITNSSDKAIELPQHTRVQLPVCEVCNNKLNKRFEEPAIDPVTHLVKARWLGSRSSSEWQAVGMWLAKIGLMLGHEAARYDHKELNKSAVRFGGDPPDYKWMVDNLPVPPDLSVFVHHTSMEPGVTESFLGVPEHVAMTDGTTRRSHVFQIVMPDISVTVVSHPGMTIRHPLVEKDEGWELLRGAPKKGDLASLPQYGHRTVVFRRGLLAHEGFQIDTSDESRLLSFIGHQVEQVPEVYPRIADSSRWSRFRKRPVFDFLRKLLGRVRIMKRPH